MKHKLFGFLIGTAFSVISLSAQDVEVAENLATTVVETAPAAPAVPAPTPVRRPAAPRPVVETMRDPISVPEVVTYVATKTPRAGDGIVASVDTLAVSELRQNQRFSVEDFLRMTPGTSVVSTGGAGSQTSLFVRGMESDHTVVLLNGRRLPPGLAGLYQIEYLDISQLESVQLHRGPVSSLYGSSAIAGALDLRTTDARHVENNGVSTYVEGGSFSTIRSGAMASFREGRLGGAFDYAMIDTKNDRPRSDYDNRTFRGNVAYDVADGVWLDMLGHVQASSLQVPGSSYQNTNFPESQINENQSVLLSPRLTIERDNWDFQTFYSYSKNELEATRTIFLNDNFLAQGGHEAEALINYRPSDDATLTIGTGYYEYDFDRTPLTPGFFNTPANFRYSFGSVFGQADLDLPGNFNLLTSIRHDSHSRYEDATTYSLLLSHQIAATDTTIFGKYATGYKSPSGQDILFLPFGTLIDSLVPEESNSWELGVKQKLFEEKASLGVTYFKNDIANLVDTDPFNFAFSQVDAETSGFEVEARFQVTPELEVYHNYTYLDATVTGGAGFAGLPGDRLQRRPRHTINGGAVLSGDAWNLGAEVQAAYDRVEYDFATSRFFNGDNYLVTRLFGAFDLSDKVELYGRIENLFDTEYHYVRGFEAPGFGAFTGLRMAFGE